MTDSARLERIESSFNLLKPKATALVDTFYDLLFAQFPQVRGMFPADLDGQKGKLVGALAFVVANVRNPDALAKTLREMGARHVKYGTREEHYPIVRDVMLQAMARTAGSDWNQTLEQDWAWALNTVAALMIEGAQAVGDARGKHAA